MPATGPVRLPKHRSRTAACKLCAVSACLLAALAVTPCAGAGGAGTSALTTTALPDPAATRRSLAILEQQFGGDVSEGGTTDVTASPRSRDQVWAEALEFYGRLSGQPVEMQKLPAHAVSPAEKLAPHTAAKADAPSGNLLKLALNYRGVPYHWGGSTRAGLDCSGLVVRAAADAGKRLPHSAARLHQLAQPVPDGDLRPGDLVFFANTYRPGISHVGIYSGGTQFLQASSARGAVGMGDLSRPYYRRKYAGAGRLTLVQDATRRVLSSLHTLGKALIAPFSLGPPAGAGSIPPRAP